MTQTEQCTGCEGKPSHTNNPCAVCGKSQPEQEPFAWQVEMFIDGVWVPLGNPQRDKTRAEALASNSSLPKEQQRIFPLYTTPPQQEPVAWMYPDALCDRSCLYVCTKAFTQFPECATTPPQRTWVGLTNGEFVEACQMAERGNYLVAFKRIQECLKEKNT